MPQATTVYEAGHQIAAVRRRPVPASPVAEVEARRSTPIASRSEQVVVVNRAFFAGAAVVVAHGKFHHFLALFWRLKFHFLVFPFCKFKDTTTLVSFQERLHLAFKVCENNFFSNHFEKKVA